jgi:hypothetical protein
MPLDLDKLFNRVIGVYKKGFNEDDVILKLEENGYYNLVVNNDNRVLAEKEFIYQDIVYSVVLGIPTTKQYGNPVVHFRLFMRFDNARFVNSYTHYFTLDIEVDKDFFILEKIAEFIAVFVYNLELFTYGKVFFNSKDDIMVFWLQDMHRQIKLRITNDRKAIMYWEYPLDIEEKITIKQILDTEQENWKKILVKVMHKFVNKEENKQCYLKIIKYGI